MPKISTKKFFSVLISFLLVFELTFFPLNSLFFGKSFQKSSSFVFAQAGPPPVSYYVYPRAPQRFISYLRNMEGAIDELIDLNKELKDELAASNCKYAISQCLPSTPALGITKNGKTKCFGGKVLGSPYPNPEKIKKYREEIKDKITALSYQRKLLETEIKTHSLDGELKSLKPKLAKELSNRINEVLKKSDEIISESQKTEKLYSEDYTKNCYVSCVQESCEFSACLQLGTGAQKNISIKVKIGVELEDMDLGRVDIDKFGLALPDKLKLPHLGDIVLNIPAQTASVCSSTNQINLSLNPPSFASLPELKFSCPSLFFNIPNLPSFPQIFKLPERINLPSFSAQGPNWCQNLTRILSQTLDQILEPYYSISQEISKLKGFIDKEINQIESQIRSGKAISGLQGQNWKTTSQSSVQKQTSSADASFSQQSSKEINYQSSTALPAKDLSLSYQCSQQGSTTKKVEPSTSVEWYFKKLAWLMSECAELPTMSGSWGLKEKAKDCYDPKKVISTINQECQDAWKDYCDAILRFGYSYSYYPFPKSFPEICKKLRYSKFPCHITDPQIAAAVQCQNLFKAEKEEIPSSCKFTAYYSYKPIYSSDFNPIQTLKNKCQQLEDKGRKDPPEPCKMLHLFTGVLNPPPPEAYLPASGSSCPAQKILDLPFNFGGGVGLDCSLGFSGSLKIELPDIIIPDIIGPSFSIPPFLKIKLPSLITEDLRLPDINLCSLDKCANIFPSLRFNFLNFNLPSFGVSVPVPKLNTRLEGRIEFPSIRLSLPSLELFNLLAPELSLPKIQLPQPKLIFAVTGVDTNAIFSLISTFILNALGVPDFGGCLILQIPSTFLSIIFPDYYFSFKKFPEAPKIPYCDEINGFCQDIKDSLGRNGWLNKAKEIEKVVNDKISQIQREIDKATASTETELQNQINNIFKRYAEAIFNEVVKQLNAQGLSVQDYIDPQTGTLDLGKVPFPGVRPIEGGATTNQGLNNCLFVRLPEQSIVLRFVTPENLPKNKVQTKNNKTIIYIPLSLPDEISLPWPQKLKEILLPKPISYHIGSIPLSELTRKKEFPLKGPGFQPRTFTFSFGPDSGDCLAKPPTGGNPVPINKIESSINKIKNIQNDFKKTSQIIKDILE